jgi:Threonine aldolase
MASQMQTIDLRSDTVTKPSTEMREAARDADVGDDVYRDDPTVNTLEQQAADLLGTEDALYVPSGTMGNQIAVRVHTDRGQELLLDREAHIYRWELGGVAQLSEVQIRTIDAGTRAAPTPEQIQTEYIPKSLHRPGTGLLALENTHNYRGGVAVPPETIAEAAAAAHEHDIPVHIDGARLCNAAVALETDLATLVEPADSVMFCLSKGLGAPIGSVLAGSAEFIADARRTRKLLGGGMRQAGMVAAPGLRALDNIDRLATDHENATALAAGLDSVPGLSATEPDTNLVMVDSHEAGIPAEKFSHECQQAEVLANAFSEYVTRFCTHLDVDARDIDVAIDRISTFVAENGD